MKILETISEADIPNMNGRKMSAEMVDLLKAAESLSTDAVLPVTLDTKNQENGVRSVLKKRGYKVRMRGLTLYISRNGRHD